MDYRHNGVTEGTYHLKVEMYEDLSSGEKLYQTTRELIIDYVPQTRQARLIKIPFVKNVTGVNIAVISNQEKQLYLDLEKTAKKEQISRRNVTTQQVPTMCSVFIAK